MDKVYTSHRVSSDKYITLIRDGNLTAKELEMLIAHLKIDIGMFEAIEKTDLPNDEITEQVDEHWLLSLARKRAIREQVRPYQNDEVQP